MASTRTEAETQRYRSNVRFYEDFSVKRHASRRYLIAASDRNGEDVESKVGEPTASPRPENRKGTALH
jgi:hypothetical protein